MLGRPARLLSDRRGATTIEYGLILALIFIVMALALRAMASTTIGIWMNVSNKVVNS